MKQVANLVAIVFGMILFVWANNLFVLITNIVEYIMIMQNNTGFTTKIGIALVSFAVMASFVFVLFKVYKGNFKIDTKSLIINMFICLFIYSICFIPFYNKMPINIRIETSVIVAIFRLLFIFIIAFVGYLCIKKMGTYTDDKHTNSLLSIIFGGLLSININFIVATISKLIHSILYWITSNNYVAIGGLLWIQLLIYGWFIYIAIMCFKKKRNITISITGILVSVVLFLFCVIVIGLFWPLIIDHMFGQNMDISLINYFSILSKVETIIDSTNLVFYIILTIIACVYLRKANREEYNL